MIDKFVYQQEVEESVEGQEFEAQDSWVQAFIEGNSIWPQSGTAMNGLVAEALVNKPPADWQQIKDSYLSDAQISTIGHLMSAMHRASQIDVATPQTVHTFNNPTVRTLPPERFQRLWSDTVDRTLKSLAKYVELSKNYTLVLTGDPVTTLNSFFANERNKPAFDELALILKKMGEVLHGQAMTRVTKELRKSYTREKGPQYETPGLQKDLQEALQKEAAQTFMSEMQAALPQVDKRVLNQFLMTVEAR